MGSFTSNFYLLLPLKREGFPVTLRALLPYALVASLLLPGCVGTGKVVSVDLKPLPLQSHQNESPQKEALLVAVDTFKDGRQDKRRIGLRTHFWGGVTFFDAWKGEMGEGMANLTVDYLKQDGWNAIRSGAKDSAATNSPNVILTGQVLNFDTHAKSGFGFTTMDVKLKVRFEATNTADGSSVRMVLGSNGTDTVMSFDPKDLQKLASEVARELFEGLFRDITLENGEFRLRSGEA